jgi:hypothetical protein
VLDGDIFTFGESTLHQTHHNDVVRSRGQRVGDDHGCQCGKNFEGEQNPRSGCGMKQGHEDSQEVNP